MPAALGSNDVIAPADDPLHGLPFRALRRLGGGSTGEVFLAEHLQLGKICVVKILHPRVAGDEDLAARFRLATRALGHLRSPHIVSVSGAGITVDERPFIVMEFLEGRTVAQELEQRRQLPILEALDYVCQLLRALSAAHKSGIVHRDIRPENLFLCDRPDGVRTLKVVDFGLTRILPDAPADAPQPLPVPTDASMVMGAPRYISPEGAQGGPVDHRADVYAAALVLYVMIAGRGPFDHRRSEALLLSAHATEAPKPPSHFAKAIPAEVDSVLLRALRKDPKERFQTADAFREVLEQLQLWFESSLVFGLEASMADSSSFAVPPSATREKARPEKPQAIRQPTQPARPLDGPLDKRSSAALPRSGPFPILTNSKEYRTAGFPISAQEAILLFLGAAALAAAAAVVLVGVFGLFQGGR